MPGTHFMSCHSFLCVSECKGKTHAHIHKHAHAHTQTHTDEYTQAHFLLNPKHQPSQDVAKQPKNNLLGINKWEGERTDQPHIAEHPEQTVLFIIRY